MIKVQTKNLIVFFTIIGFVLNAGSPGIAQINPSWGNHEPNGTGNTLPPYPNGGTFVRQDPMPKNLQDITIFSSTNKNISLHLELQDAFDYETVYGSDGEKYRRYKADNRYQVLSGPGQPEILSRLIWLQVPFDAKNIKIQETKPNFKEENKERINLYPRPHIIFEEDKEKNIPIEQEQFYIDDELYQKDTWSPVEYASITQEGYKHGMHQIQIAIPAMRYNPKQKNLKELKAMSCTISYESESRNNNLNTIDASSDPFHEIFIDTIANYAYQKTEPSLNPTQGFVKEIPLEGLTDPDWANSNDFFPDYLVIAAKKFRTSPALMNWAGHRSTFGDQHKIAIAYTDEIYQAYNQQNTKEENIKDFIQMVYDSWRPVSPCPVVNLHYLLLVGDADYSHDNEEWFLPTWRTQDPYMLSGSAGDNDYVWLEEESGTVEDYLNDVLLGRLPAQTEEELAILTNKIITFENNPPQTENHYGTRILWMSSGPTENLVRDLIVGTSKEDSKYELEEYNCNYEFGIPEFSYDNDKIKNFLDTDGALFLSYMGHGSPSLAYEGWTGWYPGVIPEELNNAGKMPLVVMSHSCSTARFDYAHPEYNNMIFPSYGENWIKKAGSGSICFWGATRQAGGSTWSRDQNFYQAIIDNNRRNLGVILDEIRAYYPITYFYNVDYLHHKIFILLGDPAISFAPHFQQSTKPDFGVLSTVSYSNPCEIGSIMSVFSKIINNSPRAMSNIHYQLFSVNEGNVEPLCNIKSASLEPYIPKSTPADSWIYNGESSIHLMCWVDPLNLFDERSEFNNHINSIRKYYPIYVDQKHIGEEHGTQKNPYGDLPLALQHAEEHDLIGKHYYGGRTSYIPIYLYSGSYGNGRELDCDRQILLEGKDGHDQTIIYDHLTLSAPSISIKDITFNGSKMDSPLLTRLRPENKASGQRTTSSNSILRSVFKNSNNYAIDTDRSLIFENCLFFNNYGVIRDLEDDGYSRSIWLENTTVSENENNLKLSNSYQSGKQLYFFSNDSIFWNNGPSVLPEEFSTNDLRIKIAYSDFDDLLFLENMYPNFVPEGNILADPKFMNPNRRNFHLKPNSPCIDAAGWGIDPDGSPKDMGAYGGYDATIRPIRIISPIHEDTIYVTAPEIPFEYALDIQWNAYQLSPQDLVHIEIYHFEYEQMAPDKGNPVFHYLTKKVVDLDTLAENNGVYSTIIEQAIPTRAYWLTITNHQNSKEFEKINFIISSEQTSIQSNR
ncbi:MAG: C25 family cysteine peptidase [Candidatus Omnitrophica bacterium]|nr:C25 family cysteine peptidase [Candidatus Omnitrophota bacterium]